jgi:metal-sulfur cluster biosynthetic enzyme
MAVTEEQVRLALEQVIDPELFVNIVDLGLIYKVEITETSDAPPADDPAAQEPVAQENAGSAASSVLPAGAEVSNPGPPSAGASPQKAPGGADVLIEMTMTSPACPAGPELLGRSKTVTSALEGVRNVDVKLVMTPPWSPDRMTEAARDQLGIF